MAGFIVPKTDRAMTHLQWLSEKKAEKENLKTKNESAKVLIL